MSSGQRRPWRKLRCPLPIQANKQNCPTGYHIWYLKDLAGRRKRDTLQGMRVLPRQCRCGECAYCLDREKGKAADRHRRERAATTVPPSLFRDPAAEAAYLEKQARGAGLSFPQARKTQGIRHDFSKFEKWAAKRRADGYAPR